MHKNIVEQIKRVVENCSFKEHFEVFVKTQETGGFWAMMIVSDKQLKGYLSHIERMSLSLGSLYGEGLYTEIKGTCLRIS